MSSYFEINQSFKADASIGEECTCIENWAAFEGLWANAHWQLLVQYFGNIFDLRINFHTVSANAWPESTVW